ncbi:MAG: hypothetical protein A2Z98_12475 [Spirochaetes bacterium GWB1_27_13]|nr:MAG: hypothetical protein A2Z98_12475 [Spirochaetes bacterium GWB1_27_13]
MWNKIPLIGWLLDFIFKVSLAVPFWFCWKVCRLGQKFFGFLPTQYQNIGFWETVGLFIITGIIFSFVKIMQVSNTTNIK